MLLCNVVYCGREESRGQGDIKEDQNQGSPP